ncbi:metal ABC transporter ATP-binding protein [Peptostreptococcus equinus]|uniref:Metal ABC transporter ATP-binding protein n=1 Tax=Peptostreptococcus equinus TaxID=3003601 RepID=A0ABY7JQA3_9FIRM|nr:metal ABC transporter ATP-binding protein [Peptostreptococcus sp. CBA3647]WAW15537.1 metal ABC transporter ATP-binding protein [Peptostreptococcus sp. CBA3647]
MNQIEVVDLTFGYTYEKIIDNLNFSLRKGKIATIVGENGSGKSTLLKLILGELKAESGKIIFENINIQDLATYEDIAYVPQLQNFNQISFPITVLEIVVLNLYRDFGFIKIASKSHKNKAIEVLKKLGLEKYIHTPYNELSGGLKQRTMIARALMQDPKLLILDEPTSGVDQKSKIEFLKLIEQINEKNNTTILIVSHELTLLKEHLRIDNCYKMEGGKLIDATI